MRSVEAPASMRLDKKVTQVTAMPVNSGLAENTSGPQVKAIVERTSPSSRPVTPYTRCLRKKVLSIARASGCSL